MIEVIMNVPLDDRLHESPFNPRKNFDAAALEEVAQTMRQPFGRVLQPIVVRPASAHNLAQPGEAEHFEIVFGHRRARAAALAGLATIPAIVRAMTDEEVKRAQVVENLQREDVSPIEEADAMKALRADHGASIEDLMLQSGKKRSYVYNRLRLADAHDDVRAAVSDGAMDAEVAQELARLPKPLQPRALHSVWGLSYRNAKAELERSHQFKLAAAPFDPLSIKLLPEAGACDSCLKRSDRESVLLDECGPNVCMDGICYGKKAAAARAMLEREAREKAPATRAVSGSTPKPSARGAGEQDPEPFNTAAAEGDLPAGEAGGEDDASHTAAATHGLSRYDGMPPQERAVCDPACWHRVRQAVLSKVVTAPRTTEDLQLLLHRELELCGRIDAPALTAIGWDSDIAAAIDQDELVRHKIATAGPADLAALLVMIGIMDIAGTEQRQALASRYGVDVIEASGVQIPTDAAQRDLVSEAGSNGPPTKPKKAPKYRDAATGATWSGKGLQPNWLKTALANGRELSEFTA